MQIEMISSYPAWLPNPSKISRAVSHVYGIPYDKVASIII
jgi:hypothetical protein